jgi:hypothetical protein
MNDQCFLTNTAQGNMFNMKVHIGTAICNYVLNNEPRFLNYDIRENASCTTLSNGITTK